ncbi:hypothetical protein [Actinokineospora diospyrosa]|uniref:Uncharacterized protein n=1 Tax=Actinokineospora diospyrosa TaxID=103728 RepID=A0ABT1IBC6_9PSEU|nr:hypothetical protein [Actinokineospora diospyrosa]MCP2269938.1 hypothetical protein [Actinokineospora diospyrosa]
MRTTKRRLSFTSAVLIVLGLVTSALLVLVSATEATPVEVHTTSVGLGREVPHP